MANRLLLQTLVKFREGIKSGAAKVSDVIEDYFKTSGKQPTEEERALIMNEFIKDAPSGMEASGVTRLGGKTEAEKLAESEGVDVAETILPTRDMDFENMASRFEGIYRKFINDKLIELQEASPAKKSKMIKEIINRQGEFKNVDQADISMLLRSVDDSQLQDFLKVQAQKPTTLKPKRYLGYTEEGRPIKSPVYFDDMGANEKSIDFSKYKNKREREEYAEFVRKMRGEGISNQQIRDIAKTTGDIESGKRAATTIARSNDMVADTKLKQEVLSELDEMKADRGPRYFQGDEFGGGPMGYDSYGEFLDAEASKIINSIEEDLIAKGMPEEKAEELLSSVRELRRDSTSPLRNDLKGLVNKISDEIDEAVENDKIKFFYDTRFWDKYVDEILRLTQKPKPRFEYGGMV
jgi:hypothetical protein